MTIRTLIMVAVYCSFVSTALHADVLATFDRPLTVGIFSDIPVSVVDIDVRYLDDTLVNTIPGSVIFDGISAGPPDEGSLFTSDATNDLSFPKFADLLTNGSREVIWTGGNIITGVNGEFRGIGILLWEASDEGFGGNPLSLNGIDLWGYDIKEIQLKLKELSLDYDGAINKLSLDVTLSILGDRRLQTGDANGDGSVDFVDFLALAGGFDAPGRWVNGDFNLDGKVNFLDFLALNANFGEEESASAAIPEPAAMAMLVGLAICSVSWWRGRRHLHSRRPR